jgi:hypothetical protein
MIVMHGAERTCTTEKKNSFSILQNTNKTARK